MYHAACKVEFSIIQSVELTADAFSIFMTTWSEYFGPSYTNCGSWGSHRPTSLQWETTSLIEDTHPAIRAIGVSHTACNDDEFRQNLRSHSWMECIFLTYTRYLVLLYLVRFVG